jgi:hypothetical protein
MNERELYKLIAEGLELAHGELHADYHPDGVLLIERDDTEWWITARKEP